MSTDRQDEDEEQGDEPFAADTAQSAEGSDEVLSVHRARRVPFRRAFTDPVIFLATGLGSGCVRVAPGTVGSAAALLLWIPVSLQLPVGLQWLAVAVAVIAGVWLCHDAARRLDVHDHPAIVWDEFAGLWLALVLAGTETILGWAVVFALFRLFDVTKPWPIRELDDHLKGGSGIMADDVLAGALAGGIVLVAAGWWPGYL